jgi:hypothetical protein
MRVRAGVGVGVRVGFGLGLGLKSGLGLGLGLSLVLTSVKSLRPALSLELPNPHVAPRATKACERRERMVSELARLLSLRKCFSRNIRKCFSRNMK